MIVEVHNKYSLDTNLRNAKVTVSHLDLLC